MNLKPGQVLVLGSDHSYEVAHVITRKVAWSPSAQLFFEYMGDEHLEGDEVAVDAPVAS